MSSVIATIERAQLRRVPDFAPGDRVKVHFQVIEGSRSRVQVFEGVVIKRQGHGARETFTVRKQSFGVGVERMFPLHSPKIERIELAARGDVRRAKLYYLRDRVGKRARVRERRYAGPEVAVEPGLLVGDSAQQPDGADGAGAAGAEETIAQDTAAAPEGGAQVDTPAVEGGGQAEDGTAEEAVAEGDAAADTGDGPVAEVEADGEAVAVAADAAAQAGAENAEAADAQAQADAAPEAAAGAAEAADTPSDAGDAQGGAGAGDSAA